ncbi:FAD-dependent monooxygenase [Comamonas testosteroni]
MASEFDVCIRGAGIVGRTLALLLARERMRVALVDTAPSPGNSGHGDVRAYALNQLSREVLQSVRSWPENAYATPVTRMDVYGDAGGEVHFEAERQGVDALNWIVDVPALEAQLAAAVRYQSMVEVVASPVNASLTVVCEGRHSRTREEFGVEFATMPYHQTAIATRVQCEVPHGQAARQWFSPAGDILAFLPLGGVGASEVAVVWSLPEKQVPALKALADDEFADTLQSASQGALGRLTVVAERAAWPLQQSVARQWCGPMPGSDALREPASWVLAGDSAHAVHPLAGQGLNLGMADVAALARLLTGEDARWRHLGDLRLLRRYERERKARLAPIGLAMDGIQQLFTRAELPLANLRNWGMSGFERSGPLKAWVTRQAMGVNF